jgi:HEAT repeat protein
MVGERGAVGHRPALSLLIEALKNPVGMLRGCSAWSLGALTAQEAAAALHQALAAEDDAYARTRLQIARATLATLRDPAQAGSLLDRRGRRYVGAAIQPIVELL